MIGHGLFILKSSLFRYNVWLYNIREYVVIVIISVYYSKLMRETACSSLTLIMVIGYTLCTVFYFLITLEAFFIWKAPYNYLFSTTVIIVFGVVYCIELLRSD